ncbi:MAG: hypothetical protein IJM25_04080 [Eubacterium sp.]|nr:hypothetical protein [Eubacterium sp.]
MKTGWLHCQDNWYYLGRDGAMVTGATRTISGKEYKFGADGVCMNP